uniref:uncharacterized protein LOC129504366 n=1 Tax=Nyctereutes procyonoides TaxID=34880 RepID=UPI00244376A3|nr:uncharacterized protein LOC129504366 [Nyctereutes procyonoides]
MKIRGVRARNPPPEPRITLKVGGQPVTFLVDTGAQHSVLTEAKGPLSSKTSWVQGATGGKLYRWTTERKVHLSTGQVTHSFLLVPDGPYPLLGRDLLSKVGAQIHFQQKGATITGAGGQPLQVLTLRLEDEHRLHEDSPPSVQPLDSEWLTNYPQAWVETAGMGLAVNQPPIIINLKPSATPISIRQYSMSKEAKKGIRPHIQRLLQLGILIPCQSPWNTPLLPVKKPGTGDYRPVQDLREVNWRTEDIHPTVPNPYNLLSTLPPSHVWYTVLDLKDAFFCLRLSSQSQPIFAFEWKDPETGFSGQLTWTRLPQGFKNSPTLFDEALHRDLADFRVGHPDLVLLQYVDDLLLAARTEQDCVKETESPSLVMHDCHQILAEVHGTRGDLTDQPLPDAEATWYTDGSSFLRNGWTEAFPTKQETAQVDVKKILEEIFPQFGLPKVIGSDNGPAFVSQDRLKALQITQHQIWKPLAAVYRPGDTTGPHPFQIGDSVYVRRHQSRTLEPRWKGPYTVLLTTPTALKVDGIAAWVHASHVQRAPSTSTADASQDGPDEPLQWKLHRTQNPLKIRLSKIVQ